MNASLVQEGLIPVPLTVESISVLLGSLAALAFDRFPGLNTWFNDQTADHKRQLVMAALALLVGAVAFGGCNGLLETGFRCQPNALPDLIRILLLAAASNQATHLLAKPASGTH